jgi:NAD(P)-dependent dehydrogenase (short-subunit alcohol dehydrogenase family)
MSSSRGVAKMADLDLLYETLGNLKGASFTVREGLPFLNAGGSIILTGSVASVKGTAVFGVYAASKAAIRSFVRRGLRI